MALLVFLFFTQSFSGSNMVSYYTITIFQVSRDNLETNNFRICQLGHKKKEILKLHKFGRIEEKLPSKYAA